MTIEERAWQLYVALVAQSLHVDCYENGELKIGKQPAYIDVAELAFKAARCFEMQAKFEAKRRDND